MTNRVEGNIVDIHHRRIFPGAVYIEHGKIIKIVEYAREKFENYILPGFVDAHVHIESSMLTPVEFSKLAVQRGTVAIVNDPHEIANILGEEGISFMLENSKEALIKIFFTIPSCVPTTDFDNTGISLSSDDVAVMAKSGKFIGLSEVMNVPGVLHKKLEIVRKLEIARSAQLPIDGHAPTLSGVDLKKYIQMGITTDHECKTFEEGLEKAESGMKILIREGSSARNYEALKSLISLYPDQIMFCMDDSHPSDIIQFGEIDKLVKRAINDGFDLFDVLRIASYNPICHYNLDVGTLKQNDPADFIVVKDLVSFDILSVYISGKERFNINQQISFQLSSPIKIQNRFNRGTITVSDLEKRVTGAQFCIGVLNGEIETLKKTFTLSSLADNFQSDVERDILKLVYLNRYQSTSIPQISYIQGIGLKRGAFATSVSHDSHNIIAVGASDEELARAINAVICSKGGLSIVDQKEVFLLPLPIAGIISDMGGYEVAETWNQFIVKLNSMGCILDSPFMTLSFMALIVVPELKIGENGLFEYSKFSFITET